MNDPDPRESSNKEAPLAEAFTTTVPVLLGYTAIGIAFGLLVYSMGYPWWVVFLMSALIYAGAGQFIGIDLLSAGSGIPEIGLVTLLVNSRHMVYGLSLHNRFHNTGGYKPYLIFALTDETYALLTTTPPVTGSNAGRAYFLVAFLNQMYWISAGMIGFSIGKYIPFSTEGLGFALTALFVVLLIEQLVSCRKKLPFIIAGCVAVGTFLLAGRDNMLIISLVVSIAALMVLRRRLE